ncbi:UNVERIFIED_CONTAM: hypothetical protein FKN15_055444 [Acipenser sinensis]
MQPPKSYSVRGQRSSREATGKPVGDRSDYRGRWCAMSRGHPDRPNPPSPRATLGQLCAAPWKLPSSIGKGIAWIRTRDLQAIERILHSRGAPLLDAPLGSQRSDFKYVIRLQLSIPIHILNKKQSFCQLARFILERQAEGTPERYLIGRIYEAAAPFL